MLIKIARKTYTHTFSNLFLNFISSIQHSKLHKHTADIFLLTKAGVCALLHNLPGEGFYNVSSLLIRFLEILYVSIFGVSVYASSGVCVSVSTMQTHGLVRLHA